MTIPEIDWGEITPARMAALAGLSKYLPRRWRDDRDKKDELEKRAIFAPGIPSRNTQGSLTALQAGQLATLIRHMHDSARAGCFWYDTPVLLSNGSTKPISQIAIGDTLFTRNGIETVTKVWYNGLGDDWMKVSDGQTEIICTPNHLFWINDLGWLPIGCLEGTAVHVNEKKELCVRYEDLRILRKKFYNHPHHKRATTVLGCVPLWESQGKQTQNTRVPSSNFGRCSVSAYTNSRAATVYMESGKDYRMLSGHTIKRACVSQYTNIEEQTDSYSQELYRLRGAFSFITGRPDMWACLWGVVGAREERPAKAHHERECVCKRDNAMGSATSGAISPFIRRGLASSKIYGGGTLAAGDRSIGRLLANAGGNYAAKIWFPEKRAYRAHAAQMLWIKQLELERRGVQQACFRLVRGQTYSYEDAEGSDSETRNTVRRVWKTAFRQSYNRAPHCAFPIFEKSRRQQCANNVFSVPQSGRSSISSQGGRILCIERLPGLVGGRWDLEVTGEHCYRVAGFLVHNSHTDVRVGSPDMGLLSWATKKQIPGVGDRPIRLFRQPIHTWQYGSFQGTIPEGYGKGRVWIGGKNEILVTKAQPDKLNFTIADERGQERFSLFQTKDGGWLLSNVTPQAPGMLAGNGKVKYTSVDPEDAEKLIEGGHATSAKIDGAAMVGKILGDKIEAVSYRTRKDKNTLIPYTERLGLYNVDTPPEIKNQVLKGEIYAQNKEGKVLPPQELSGLLNMNLAPMLRKNKETGTRLRVALYAIAGAKTPRETAERLREILPKLPKDVFTIAPTESDPVKAMRMYQTIKSGEHPLTSEGVVLTPPEGGAPIKSKFLKEDDVVIRRIFPAETKSGDARAGGFEYSRPGSSSILGRVSGGIPHETARDMLANPEKYMGRTARVKHQGEFPSGALRAPTAKPESEFLALHEDIPQE